MMETCSDDIDANLFRTSQVNGTRLRAIAIQHAVPSVNCMPIWPNEIAFMITSAILTQKGRMSKAMTKAHEEGVLQLPWTNLNVKGVPSYRPPIMRGPLHVLHCPIGNQMIGDCCSDLPAHELSDFFACPKCNGLRNINKCSLFVRSGWGHILCLTCRVTSRSKTWNCICDIPWHTCSIHAARFRLSDTGMHEVPD